MSRKKKGESDTLQLEMTPMIDVVFQLLIFFLVAFKDTDILSHLDVNRPSVPPDNEQVAPPIPLLEIMIDKNGYVMQGSRVSLEETGRQLKRYADISRSFSLIIKCGADSKHSNLVKLLDTCSLYKLNNLNVLSM